MTSDRLPERSIPDRGPGHAFIPIADAGWRRHFAGWWKDSSVMGALSPCRDPFTLTSILSHQGRGGKARRPIFIAIADAGWRRHNKV